MRNSKQGHPSIHLPEDLLYRNLQVVISTAGAIRSPLAFLLLRYLRDEFAFLDRGTQILQYKELHVLLRLICGGSNMWQ